MLSNSRGTADTRSARGRPALSSTRPIDSPALLGPELAGGERVQFLPGLRVLGKDQLAREPGTLSLVSSAKTCQGGVDPTIIDPLVLVAGADHLLEKHAEDNPALVRRHSRSSSPASTARAWLRSASGSGGILHEIVPDIVVFDESFVDHAVPFGAFTARKSLFACWNRPGKATFHSTTFQPNTISTLHFMHCSGPGRSRIPRSLSQGACTGHCTDLSRRGDWFRRYYNPALYRLIRATGFNTSDVRAAGSFVVVDGRPIFDAVSGVACSFRGHNPALRGRD